MAEQTVITPLPGTFYRKATPDSPNYVEPVASARFWSKTVIR